MLFCSIVYIRLMITCMPTCVQHNASFITQYCLCHIPLPFSLPQPIPFLQSFFFFKDLFVFILRPKIQIEEETERGFPIYQLTPQIARAELITSLEPGVCLGLLKEACRRPSFKPSSRFFQAVSRAIEQMEFESVPYGMPVLVGRGLTHCAGPIFFFFHKNIISVHFRTMGLINS